MSENRSNVRVTQEQIDSLIQNATISVETRFDKVTVVCCKLDNGFVITEAAGCVDPVNYSQDTGFKICMERIENKLWELEGYALQKQVHEGNVKWPLAELWYDLCFGSALTAAKMGNKIARKGWNGKGMFLYYVPAAAYPPSTEVAKEAFGGEPVPYGAYIAMKTAQGNVVPWLASQNDMLADDWYILN